MIKPLFTRSAQRYYEILPQELPLCCPLPGNRLWDSHPRVYLPLAKMMRVTCPYCGTVYFLSK